MPELEVGRVLRHLDVTFDAALANDEELAATDLAYSLLQGLDLFAALRRWGSAELHPSGGPTGSIDELGRDFVAARGATLLCRHPAVVAVRRPGGRPPVVTDDTLVERLRSWARSGTSVQVRAVEGPVFGGRLVRVAPDHLEVASDGRDVIVAFGSLAWIRSCRGD